MNLLVEIGNTALKAALSEGMTLGKTFRYQGEKKIDYILSLVEREKPQTLLVASVAEITAAEEKKLSKACHSLIILDNEHKDVLKGYGLPDHISFDRAAAILATRRMFAGKSCTLFDFGTTISIDFIQQDGTYAGGNVSLGLMTRLKALHRYSKSLPLIEIPVDAPFAGSSLETSIEAGVISGIMFEIQGYIASKQAEIVVFTGGDANYFVKRIKNSIFVICNLVLMGLALIAEEYADEKNI